MTVRINLFGPSKTEKGIHMSINLEQFKLAYEKWVEESMPDFQVGKMAEIVKTYPFVVSDDIPWVSLHR